MIYEWRKHGAPGAGVDAQTVGEAIASIAEREGMCTPARLVQEAGGGARDLHRLFTWDDAEAAQRWRVQEARNVINAIVVRVERNGQETEAPAFVSVGRIAETQDRGAGYRPVQVVVQDPEFRAEALQEAIKDLNAIRRRYEAIKELSPVWDLVDRIAA